MPSNFTGRKRPYFNLPKLPQMPITNMLILVLAITLFAAVITILIPFITNVIVSAQSEVDQSNKMPIHAVRSQQAFNNLNEILRDKFVNMITKPLILCVCFELNIQKCKMIETAHSDIQRQVVEVVNAWHETFVSLDKHEVFSAL